MIIHLQEWVAFVICQISHKSEFKDYEVFQQLLAQSAGAVEYTDWISAEL